MDQPHDALFRFVFADVDHAGPLLRSALPSALAAAIDWRTLQRLPEPQVDDRQRTQTLDLVG